MQSGQHIKDIHEAAVEHKRHMWDHHGERSSPPSAALIFRDAGLQDLKMRGAMDMWNTMVEAQREEDEEKAEEMLSYGVPYMLERTISMILKRSEMTEQVTEMLGDSVAALIESVAADLPKVGDKVEELWLVLDAYVTTATDTHDIVRGDLEKDFSSNPASEVKEMLFTMVYSDDLVGGVDVQSLRSIYRVTDGGRIAFEEAEQGPDAAGETTGGLMHDAAMTAFAGDRVVT